MYIDVHTHLEKRLSKRGNLIFDFLMILYTEVFICLFCFALPLFEVVLSVLDIYFMWMILLAACMYVWRVYVWCQGNQIS